MPEPTGSICHELISKSLGNRHLGKLRRRWEDNIRMELKK